ncbi:thioredoxin-like domain-containing protein [Singulisphaera sp. PoT]|uniref:thioredoxin-like domain-containing protein n=1 Tax=Singulisphaera sp. PoT TaxID=3411797 RepID=UPI003BF5C1CE
MRSLRTLVVTATLVGAGATVARAQVSPSPENLLKLEPSLKGVEYEVPAPQAVAKCKVETVHNADKTAIIGYALRDEQGKLLRKFLDTRGKRGLDQWSYYQDGFEVYRESDLNDDKTSDECRWMNSGGTRIAKVTNIEVAPKEWKLKLDWTRISAEEASKVLVQSLVMGDRDLLESVMATPEDLKKLGVPQSIIDKSVESAKRRKELVGELQASLKGWNKSTVWNRLDGMMPHLIPAGTETNLKDDLVLYENAVIFAGSPSGQANPEEMAFLQTPELIKIGETWKFVELPKAVDPKKPILAAEGGIRAEIFGRDSRSEVAGQDPVLEAAIKKLAAYDEKNAGASSEKDVAEYHVGRIPLLQEVVKVVKTPEDKLVYKKSIVDSLAAAYITGFYPKGLDYFDIFIKDNSKIASYAAFRKIYAVFAAKNTSDNTLVIQKKWMADLKEFCEKYPEADETPDALFMLASGNEYNAEEEDARKYYEQLAQRFPNSDPGKKAAGAIKRLDLVGKPYTVKGPNLSNEVIDTARLRGKPVLLTFWSTEVDLFKRDLPELEKVYKKFHNAGFEIVGVSGDQQSKDLEDFLKEHPLPWPQIFIPGGMEKNPLANDLGIVVWPTMILVDGEGKVVNRNIRSAADVEKQLEKIVGTKTSGVALEAK